MKINLIFLLLVFRIYGQNTTEKDVSEICKSKLPLSSVRYYGELAVKNSEVRDGSIVVNSLKSKEKNFQSDAIIKIAKENQKVLTTELRVFKTVRTINDIIQEPVEKIPLYGTIHKKVMDEIMDSAEESLKENRDKSLVASLRTIRKKSESDYKKLIESNDREAIKAALTDAQFFSEEGLEENVSAERRHIIRQSYEDYIDNIQINSINDLYNKYDNQELNILQTKLEVGKLIDFSVQFANQTRNDLVELNKSQLLLKNEVQSLTENFERSENAQNFIEDYLFDNMSSDDKIKALDNQFFKDLNEKDRASIRKQLEIESAKEKYIQTAKTYLDNANKALGILKNLGMLDSQFGKNLIDIAQTGSTLVNSFEQFAKGDKLGAILTLTGLFGGGPDPAEVRHQEIMEQFRLISGKLDVIQQTLQEIQKLQLQSLEIQIETYELVDRFYKKSEENYLNTITSIKRVEDEVLYSRRLLYTYIYNNPVQNCYQLIEDLGIDVDKNTFPTLERIAFCVSKDKLTYSDVYQNFFRNYIIDSSEKIINPIFLLRTRSGNQEDNSLVKKMDEITNKSVELLSLYSEITGFDKRKIINSLLIPSSTTLDIQNKFNAEVFNYNGTLDKKLFRNLDVFSELIAPKAVYEFSNTSRNLIPIFQLLDSDFKLVNKIENISSTVNRVDVIEKAYLLNQLSIAQQSLLSGDILLPIFIEIINSDKEELIRLKPKVFQLLKINNLLLVNFSRYYTRHLINTNKVNPIAYLVAFQEGDLKNLSYLLNSKIEIDNVIDESSKQNNIYFKTNEVNISLPSYSEIWDRNNVRMLWTEDQQDLLLEKGKLFQSIYECRDGKPKYSEEIKLFYLQTILPEIVTNISN